MATPQKRFIKARWRFTTDGAMEMIRSSGLTEREYLDETGMWPSTFSAVKCGEWVGTSPIIAFATPCPIPIPDLKEKGWLIERNGSGAESTRQGS